MAGAADEGGGANRAAAIRIPDSPAGGVGAHEAKTRAFGPSQTGGLSHSPPATISNIHLLGVCHEAKYTRSFLALIAASILMAQDEPAQTGGGAAGGRGGGGGAALGTPNPQPFDRVITKDAKSKKGLFTVYQVGERFFYEIPKNELGKEYLWNTQIAKNTLGAGYGGSQITDKVVAWDLRNNRVYLRDVNFSLAADPDSPIASAVKAANNDTIMMAFNVAAFTKMALR